MPGTYSITSDLYWIGSLDPSLRTFDIIMETQFGTSYNAYLLKTNEGDILFETVKEKFFDEYLEKIKSLTDLENIRYIVVDHTEPDHAGSVAKLLQVAPHITVVGSPLAIKYITHMIHAPFESLAVKDNEYLTLGQKTVRFINVPQLHWPDTMYSYIEEDKALITCDSFGAHYSDPCVFKSQLPAEKEEDFVSSYRYYFDMIMGPFKPFVQKALSKIRPLDIAYICPGHGLIFDRETMPKYIDLYDEWSQPVSHEPAIVIAYVSAYGYTAQIAEMIAEGIKAANYCGKIHLCNLETESLESVLEKVSTAQGLLLGSPTILAEVLPPVWGVLNALNPVMHRHILMGCFGSYGWSGEALTHMNERIKQLKCDMPLEPLGILFKPGEEDCQKAKAFGANFAQAIQK